MKQHFPGKHSVINVVLIEDDETIRESYRYLINASGDIQVVNTYASFEEAADHLRYDDPGVILLDIELPGKSGLDALAVIRKQLPHSHVIMLTVYDDEESIFKALSQGASGYLTKNVESEKIITAIKDVVRDGGAMSPNVARLVMRSFRRNLDTPLSKRETEILEKVAEGKSKSAIAADLFVEEETIKTHIKNIYLKLDVHSKADAIKAARENRYI